MSAPVRPTPRTPAQDVPDRPLLRVLRGAPTPDELAALVAVVAARRSAAARPTARPLWGRPHLHPVPTAGPGAWRASGLPR